MADRADNSEELIPVRDAHRFDEAQLEKYLASRLDDFRGPLRVRQMSGGQSNPTFQLDSGGQEFVMRKKPPGALLPSAHAVDREYRVQHALRESGVPVARMLLFCDDPGVIGTPFYVMERMQGRVFHNNGLPGLSRSERTAAYDAMNDVLARLHLVDWRGCGLADFGRPGNYFARQVGRWTKQYLASKQSESAPMDRLIEWLPPHIPDDDETTIVHGDYRLGNMMFAPNEMRVIAVFDWELSTLGHPLADLAYNCMPYHMEPEDFDGIAGLDLATMGIPEQDRYVADYCRRTNRPVMDMTFYIVFSMFRIAAILEGVYARYVQGNASSEDAGRVGLKAKPYAECAWDLVVSRGLA